MKQGFSSGFDSSRLGERGTGEYDTGILVFKIIVLHFI